MTAARDLMSLEQAAVRLQSGIDKLGARRRAWPEKQMIWLTNHGFDGATHITRTALGLTGVRGVSTTHARWELSIDDIFALDWVLIPLSEST